MPQKTALTEDIKLFIVDRLACFESPSTVAKAVEKEFGRAVLRQTIEAYDPTKAQGQKLSNKLREHFDLVRKRFREDTADIPIAMRAVRLRTLDRLANRFEEMGNLFGTMEALEQAAKEVGGVYTGRGGAADSKLDDGPREPQPTGADHLAELSARFAKGLTVVQGGKK